MTEGPRRPDPSRADRLLAALSSLEVAVDRVAVEVAPGAVPSYPGGSRPSSVVHLEGHGDRGSGEHVGWTRAEHLGFRDRATALLEPGSRRIARLRTELAQGGATAYERAAIEAAAIELALAQHGTDLGKLLGVNPAAVRYVVSLDRRADPRPGVAREAAAGAREFKLDVDAGWSDEILEELGAAGQVAVLDFKRSGEPPEHERCHLAIPQALIEDPLPGESDWSPSLCRRLSLDAAIDEAAALAQASPRPAAANLKPARMGGVLAAIEAFAACARLGIIPYLGGMFEIHCGRPQLLSLATVLCPDGPNDIAPIATAARTAPRPPRLAPALGRW